MAASDLSFLTFNIGNPSEQRAQRQLAWLAGRPEHVLVLTETKASAGCPLLASAFTTAGCHVTFPVPGPGEYGVMIISRVQAQPDGFGATVSYLPTRAASVTLPAPAGPIQVIGAYTPSRDAGLEKTERKRTWLTAFRAALAARDPAIPAMFLGDLNVLEPDHRPHYPFFVPFEYDFYRALIAEHGFTDAFRHLHPARPSTAGSGEPATGTGTTMRSAPPSWRPPSAAASTCTSPAPDGLSDHSALTAGLTVQPPPALAVSDPAAATVPATLF